MSDEGKHCLLGRVTRADFALSILDQEGGMGARR